MKLLIIIDDLRSGGTENVLASRLQELSDDTEVQILTLFALGPVAETIKKIGTKVDFMDLKHFGVLKTFAKLKKIIKRENFDIAVCMRDVSKALFPKFLKKYIPAVIMLWDSPVIKRSFKQSWLEWYQVRFSDAIPYCSSRNTASELNKVYGFKDTHVISNCYDRKRFSKKIKNTDSVLKIISVGGVRKEKNYKEKLKIAKILKGKKIRFKLSMIGEDPDSLIHRDIIQSRLEDSVVILGPRKDIPELLAESDLFLFTSSSEGFPVALLEAMASGLPCVCYEFPSLKEIDENFSKIEKVAQGDTNSAVDTIIHLYNHPDERKIIGEKASDYVSARFASDINAQKWLDFLKKNAKILTKK